MRASDDEVDGWEEPLVESLWRPDLIWEIPRNLIYAHLLWVVLAVFYSLKWLMMIAVAHAAFAWITKKDPEWMSTLKDFFNEPNEMEV